jgi:glycosyltransferase involved in cell wall biosynthesis
MRDAWPPLKVCVDARVLPGQPGGLETVITGLAFGLSRLAEGSERFYFLVKDGMEDWLRPYLGPNAALLVTRSSPLDTGLTALRRRPRLFAAALRAAKAATGGLTPWHLVRPSDGTIERAGIDVMHFPLQSAFLTDVPSIYHPHDLQHRHVPGNFGVMERLARDKMYRTYCRQATVVAVGSEWVRVDVTESFGLEESKVLVVPLAPRVDQAQPPTRAECLEVAERLRLPEVFLLYPAQTWQHKNHLGLIEALARIAQGGDASPLHLICTGRLTAHAARVRRRAAALGVADRVRLLGFVSSRDLECIYHLARAVVVPSLFEAGSFPIWESFRAGVPVAASNVTSLPSQVGDAGIIFDPHDPVDIAAAIDQVTEDRKLRIELIAAGRRRVEDFTWHRTAKHFRAIYRSVARRPLTDEDKQFLTAGSGF